MAYYQAINTGEGFITYEDTATAPITGYPGNLWLTDNAAWAERVGAVEKTKEEAQAIVDAITAGTVHLFGHPQAGEPAVIILP